jgi:hypothetical protein
MYDVIRTYNRYPFNNPTISRHVKDDRKTRLAKIYELIERENATIYTIAEVEEHNGMLSVIYVIYTNGVAFIYNKEKNKMITCVILRPNQLKKFNGINFTENTYNLCSIHKRKHYNEI